MSPGKSSALVQYCEETGRGGQLLAVISMF